MKKKVIGLDGREYTWAPIGYMVYNDDIRPRSKYHLRCRQLLHTLYPTCPILEEVNLPGSGGLSLDFFLPYQGIGVEVQGEQHYKMVGKFHKDKKSFIQGLKRDANKREWCKLNNIRIIELRYDGTDDEWAAQITDD